MDKKNREKVVIFIYGCQRSGTSVTSGILSKLKNVMSYPETNNPLTDQDSAEPHHTIRLNNLEDVRDKINTNHQQFIVIKPLVESQRALEIVDFFPNSKGMWLYRNYRDVVNSMVQKWGEEQGIPHLKPILTGNQRNWRSEKLPSNVREEILSLHDQGISQVDAWALFWYARNSLFFSQKLHTDPRFILMKYQKLVTTPSYLSSALMKLNLSNIDVSNTLNYNTNSVGKGKYIKFSEHVARILEKMMRQLNLHTFNE